MSIEPEKVQTNIIYFSLASRQLTVGKLVARLGNKGIKILQTGPTRLRAVTHYGISAEDINLTLAALGEAMEES